MVHECRDVEKIRGQRIQEKNEFMLKTEHAATFKGWKTGCLHASTWILQKYHLILEKDFKKIPLGKICYKGLVSVKNMKPTSLNQNLNNWKWFPNLRQNKGANTMVNFQKS